MEYDGSCVEWHENFEQTHDTSVSSFSHKSFDFGARSRPNRFRLVKLKSLGAAVNTIVVNFTVQLGEVSQHHELRHKQHTTLANSMSTISMFLLFSTHRILRVHFDCENFCL